MCSGLTPNAKSAGAKSSRISGTATLAPCTTISFAPFCSPPPNFKKFIGGEPMKSATNIVVG